jgi:hypothetical protein
VTSQDDGRNSFVRGMTIGAIIGAIVAGSSLWSRRRNRRQHLKIEAATTQPETPQPEPNDAADEH